MSESLYSRLQWLGILAQCKLLSDRQSTVQANCPDLDVRINNPFKDLGALSPPQCNAGTFSNQILLGPHVSKLRRPKQVSKVAPHSGFQQTHCTLLILQLLWTHVHKWERGHLLHYVRLSINMDNGCECELNIILSIITQQTGSSGGCYKSLNHFTWLT